MAKLTITGRVLVRESHQGVAGVVVRAVWVLDGGKELHVDELVHVEAIQQGKNDGLTEREARIRENRYRDVRGAGFHRELP